MSNAILEVQKTLEADGFYPESIIADGKIQRFKRNSQDKGLSGWYLCHQNHSDRGDLFCVAVWGDWHEQGMERKLITSFVQTKHDRAKIEEQLAKAERARKIEQERVWLKTSEESTAKWESLNDVNTRSDYLDRKKISALFGAKTQLDPRSSSRSLYVPVADLSGKIWGLQKIQGDGQKFFAPGTRKSGNFFCVGLDLKSVGELKNEDIIYLCEGFATACSINMAIGKPVVCCFDAGNLEPVAKVLREKFKDARFVVCGDEDRFTETGNAGREKAEIAAKSVLGKAVFPNFKSTETRPTDFNDLHLLEGIDVVKAQVMGVNPEVFRIFPLGHMGETYYYISSSNQQIRAITSTAHSRNALYDLMPQEYWESQFPSKQGADYNKAASTLMDACRKVGVFQADKVRGVGVWREKTGPVVNLGNAIWSDDKIQQLNSFSSQHTYEIGSKILPPHPDPMNVDECEKLREAIELLKWKRPEFAKFFVGWIIVAPLAGMLQWRPHIWLNGPTGSGKSWIMQSVVNRMFGTNRYFFQGNTTEAGIRQTIGSNARPVIFDEFETDDEKSSERIASILELVRQSSSETDGMVVKGGAGGHSIQYRIRMCCMVASVRTNLRHEQDKTRFTLLDLLRSDKGSFPAIEEAFGAIDDKYASRLFSRSVRMATVILENQKRFQTALSEKYNSRFGQQYGTLLAGYAATISDEPLSIEEVDAVLGDLTLTEESEVIQERDEFDCIDFLMKKVIRLDTISWGNTERSIHELIQQAQCDEREQPTVNRLGLRADKDRLFIATNHPELAKLFANTKWVGGWRKPLSRLAGAEMVDHKRFGSSRSRCVSIPYTSLIQN